LRRVRKLRRLETLGENAMFRILAVLSALAGLTVAGWTVAAQEPAGPKADGARLVLGHRAATAQGRRTGLAHTSAPLIDVAQPRPDTLVVTMTGLAAAGGLPCEDSAAEVAFDLAQGVTVVAPPGARVRLALEGQLAGLFRGSRDGPGAATFSVPAEATVAGGPAAVLHVALPCRTYSGKDVLLVSDRSPVSEAVVGPGEYELTQRFAVRCSHPKRCFHKNVVTAAFGPEAGKPPEWSTLLDPTRDIPKSRDFGFRVVLRAELVK